MQKGISYVSHKIYKINKTINNKRLGRISKEVSEQHREAIQVIRNTIEGIDKVSLEVFFIFLKY